MFGSIEVRKGCGSVLLLLGAFWDADRGECEICSTWNTYYCPESMCTADLHEGALPFSWQYDP